MQHVSEYAEALKCIRSRRYTPAASFMADGMVRKAAHPVSAGQRQNLTTTIARKLRSSHKSLLLAQTGGVALLAMAEQVYREVEGELAPAVATAPPGTATA